MVFQNWMSGCGFTYNETAAELIKNVTNPTAAQLKAIYACGFSTPFIMAWAGLFILIMLFLLSRKWLGEEEAFGYPFNSIYSLLGIVIYFILVSAGLDVKISLFIGLVTMIISGFGSGAIGGGG
jgi:hypothetical protein